MLYDLVPLPMRYRDGATIASTVPYFHAADMLDEIQWYGWEIDMNAIKSIGLRKYKTLEIAGDSVIERLFLCNEPIDLSKRWWTADNEMYVLYQKTHKGTSLNNVSTVRYLNGITSVLQMTGIGICLPQTIHTKILRAVANSVFWNKDVERAYRNPNHLLHHLITGNDEQNIDAFAYATNLRTEPWFMADMPYCCSWVPSISVDEASRLFINNQATLKQLALLKGPEFGVSMCSVISSEIETPFDPKGPKVKYGEADEERRWAFLRFITALQNVEATDYAIQLRLESNQIVEQKYELYNRYKGVGSQLDESEHRYALDELFVAFARWQWRNLTQPPVNQKIVDIRIYKNWLEEAYLEISYSDKRIEQYYIDFVVYSACSLSLIDRHG